MTYLLFDEPWLTLHAQRARVAAADVPQLHTALDLLAQCRALRARVAAECEARQSAAHAAGHAAGFRQGWQDAADAIERRLGAAADDIAGERLRHRDEVGALAMQIVRQLMADIGPADTISALIKGAVKRLAVEQPVLVRLHSAVADTVAARLAGGDIAVVADDGVARDHVELHAGASAIDVGLEAQLQAIELAFSRIPAASPARQ